MRLSSWLRSGRSFFVPSGTEQGHRPTRLPKRFLPTRLSVAQLEDRIVLSTFTVDNLADSGPGSLRAAITAANANPGADVIAFAHGLRGTVALTSGELGITDDLRIDGPGAGRLAVSGSDAQPGFCLPLSGRGRECRPDSHLLQRRLHQRRRRVRDPGQAKKSAETSDR